MFTFGVSQINQMSFVLFFEQKCGGLLFNLVFQFHLGFSKYKYGKNCCAKPRNWKLCEFEWQKEVYSLKVCWKYGTEMSTGMSRCHVVTCYVPLQLNTHTSQTFYYLLIFIKFASGQSVSRSNNLFYLLDFQNKMFFLYAYCTHLDEIMMKNLSAAISIGVWNFVCTRFFEWSKHLTAVRKQIHRFSFFIY